MDPYSRDDVEDLTNTVEARPGTGHHHATVISNSQLMHHCPASPELSFCPSRAAHDKATDMHVLGAWIEPSEERVAREKSHQQTRAPCLSGTSCTAYWPLPA
jgi:hypothetical protein